MTEPVLTAAQMRAAEDALIAAGTSVDELMQRAGRGAAEWVWRISGGRQVTVLCGPGNNGGDGWVIAESIRARGGEVAVVSAAEPATRAAQTARSLYQGEVVSPDGARGEVLVDCLFGTGLTRPLSDDHIALLQRLSAAHHKLIAIDLPSGVDSDSGAAFSPGLPAADLTVALGGWKPAHFLMPAAASMGALRLVDIGIGPVADGADVLQRPAFAAPAADAHKYTRGLLGVIGGAMPGAAMLAARAAQHAGAGYVKLLGQAASASADLVVDDRALSDALTDKRYAALLVGPGLGRDDAAHDRLAAVLGRDCPAVVDADALVLLAPELVRGRSAPLVLTPHDGELAALERAFGLAGQDSKLARVAALAEATAAVVVAKGADTLIAAPDGQMIYAPRASSWLSTAGTGDVLAGTIASRLASGAAPLAAAREGVWLHGEAARLCKPPFTASDLADQVRSAYAACL